MKRARVITAGLILGVCLQARGQTQYSIGNPSNEQQYMLELINRARANGGAEAARLGLSGLQEGPPNYNGEIWAIENSVQPLSWNAQLANAAQNHAQNLNAGDQFFVGGSPHSFGGKLPRQRISDAGYFAGNYDGPTTSPSHFSPGPENVAEEVTQGSGPYTRAKLLGAVLTAHNGLFTDLTVPGRGHRNTMMLGYFRELGVGISVGTDNQSNPGQPNGTWDSIYIVEDFGTRNTPTPFVTGVIYRDANGNGFYDPTEGIEGVRIDVAGSGFFAISSASGGYSVPVPGDGNYDVTFSGGSAPTRQRTITVSNGKNAKADYLVGGFLANISTRLPVQTGDNVLIGGFILSGTQPKRVVVRAIGPSLPVPGKLDDPVLELYDSNGLLASNDNWRSTQEAELLASGFQPSNDLEAAILITLPANAAYTAIVRGASSTTGVGLIEVYDLDSAADSTFANISSRGLVQTDDNVMIGGFIIQGTSSKPVVIRAVGPSLPVPGKLADPTLDLYDGSGNLIASNDNWRSTQEAELIATNLQPSNDLESAIVRILPPSAYTAIVRGKNGTTGIGLVEVYGP